MRIRRLCTLALGIFKTLNNLNPNFMKDIFNFSPYSTDRKHDIFLHRWNSLSGNIKSTSSIIIFKDFINLRPKCKWKLCL